MTEGSGVPGLRGTIRDKVGQNWGFPPVSGALPEKLGRAAVSSFTVAFVSACERAGLWLGGLVASMTKR